MNFNDDIAVRAFKAGEPRRIRIGSLHELHPGRSRGLIGHHNRFHLNTPLYQSPPTRHLRFTAASATPHLSVLSASLWTNADDRLPLDPLGRVESGNGVVEGRDGADVRPQPTIPDPLDDLTQLRTIGLDDEINRQAVRGPRLRRPGDGHQRSSSSNHTRGPLLDVAAEDVENQIDAADVFQRVV